MHISRGVNSKILIVSLNCRDEFPQTVGRISLSRRGRPVPQHPLTWMPFIPAASSVESCHVFVMKSRFDVIRSSFIGWQDAPTYPELRFLERAWVDLIDECRLPPHGLHAGRPSGVQIENDSFVGA